MQSPGKCKGIGGQTLAREKDGFWRMERFLEGDGRSELECVGENELNLWVDVQEDRDKHERLVRGDKWESQVLEAESEEMFDEQVPKEGDGTSERPKEDRETQWIKWENVGRASVNVSSPLALTFLLKDAVMEICA